MRRSTIPRYAAVRKPRAAPKKSHRHIVFRRIKHLVFALLILISSSFTALTIRDYQASLDWSNNKNGLKMAEMSPDMLQDSPKQIAIKEDFLKRANQMMDADGQIHATKSDLIALNNDLQKIKIAKPQYEKRYQQIAEKYMVRSTLKALTKNNTVTANTRQVHKALTTVGPILNAIHQKYPHDKFVEQEMHIVHNLNHDMRLIKKLLGNTAQLVNINKHIATFKSQVVYDDYEAAMKSQDQLVYKWSMLVPLTKLDDRIKDILTQQAQKINLYNAYKKDLHDKEQAYEDLRKARETHAANNAQVIEQIRQDKLAKQRQKEAEEAERKRQEEAKKKEHNSNDNSSENDDSDKEKDQQSSHHESDNHKGHSKKPNKKPKDHYVDPDQETASDEVE